MLIRLFIHIKKTKCPMFLSIRENSVLSSIVEVKCGLSKSSSACDTCLFSVSAWAFEGKDYRGLLTKALSLAFATLDVPLIVREGTHIHSLLLLFYPAAVRCTGTTLYDEFPFSTRPHYCRHPLGRNHPATCAYLGDRRNEVR